MLAHSIQSRPPSRERPDRFPLHPFPLVRKLDSGRASSRSTAAEAGDNGHANAKVLDPFRFVLIAVPGWMNHRHWQKIDYLREENRVLHKQLGGRRLRLNDEQRRRLVAKAKGFPVGLIAHVTNAVGRTEEQFDKGGAPRVMRFSRRRAERAGGCYSAQGRHESRPAAIKAL